MYAVIASGGKQYRVAEGDTIKVEKLDAEEESKISFDEVLLLNDGKETKVGTPHLANVVVEGKVIKEGRRKKIHILKFHRRKHHMKQMGHRQSYTEIKITKIGPKAKETAKTVGAQNLEPKTKKEE